MDPVEIPITLKSFKKRLMLRSTFLYTLYLYYFSHENFNIDYEVLNDVDIVLTLYVPYNMSFNLFVCLVQVLSRHHIVFPTAIGPTDYESILTIANYLGSDVLITSFQDLLLNYHFNLTVYWIKTLDDFYFPQTPHTIFKYSVIQKYFTLYEKEIEIDSPLLNNPRKFKKLIRSLDRAKNFQNTTIGCRNETCFVCKRQMRYRHWTAYYFDNVYMLPCCGSLLHKCCLQRFFQRYSSICPNCSSYIDEETGDVDSRHDTGFTQMTRTTLRQMWRHDMPYWARLPTLLMQIGTDRTMRPEHYSTNTTN